MKNLLHLRQEWGALGDQMRAILTSAKDTNRDLTGEEQEKFDRIAADADKLEDEIKRMEGHEQRQARMRQRQDEARETGEPAGTDQTQARESFAVFLRTGQVAQRGLSVSDDTKGGYLAPGEFVREILKSETEICPFRRLARIRLTAMRSVHLPKRTGQFAAVWVGEKVERTETEGLTYGLEEIPTHEMSAVVKVSQQELEDAAFNVEQIIQEEVAEQFAVAEATAFMTGNGVARPWGVTIDAAITATKSGSNGDFDADDLIDLLYSLKTVYQGNSTWLFNRTTLRKIRKLKSNNEYLWSPGNTYPNNVVQGLAPTILDRPYMIAPEMTSSGTTGAISVVVGDFRRGYLILDRVQMSVLRDPYTEAKYGNVVFWARKRVGGQVVMGEAINRLDETA